MAEPMMKANGAPRLAGRGVYSWWVQRCAPHFPPWGTRMWRIAQRLGALL